MSSLNNKQRNIIALLLCCATSAEAFTGAEIAAFAITTNSAVYTTTINAEQVSNVKTVIVNGPVYSIVPSVIPTNSITQTKSASYNITK